MDWMANISVNVPVAEVIGYMGSLYTENIVLGESMFDIDKLGGLRHSVLQHCSNTSLHASCGRGRQRGTATG